MSFRLPVFNPSHYERQGYVAVPWQLIHEQIKIAPEELAVRDSSGFQLPAQVDRIDPDDPSRDSLVFSCVRAIPPGPEDYSAPSAFVSIDQDEPELWQGETWLQVDHGPDGRETGVKLVNNQLTVWLCLAPAPGNDKKNWYAGSATSVVSLHRDKEVLDPFVAERAWTGHDPEKRCMQVDQLQLPCPAWETMPCRQVTLFNKPYRLVAQSSGPVRASVTIASEPFDYSFRHLGTQKEHELVCQLYRVLSLYAGADFVIEELFVKGTPDETTTQKKAVNLVFAARFFTYMDLGPYPQIYQFPHIRDWFAVGSLQCPYPGYGFATNVHASPVVNPHPDFPDVSTAHRSFSWQLLPGNFARCLHLFKRDGKADFDSQIGRRWYEFIYKPLAAGLTSGGALLP